MTSHRTTTRARAPQVLDRPRFALLAGIATRLAAAPSVDGSVLDAVAVLTADADPERAARLAPGPGEPPALVERLAVWALHRASDEAVATAGAVLGRLPEDRSPAPAGPATVSAAVARSTTGRPVVAAACGAA
jgi:hypothetical protein